MNMVSFTFLLFGIFAFANDQNEKVPRRALIILNPTDGIFNQCFGQPKLAQLWFQRKADHLLGPINALRAWSRNNTNADSSFFDVTFFTRVKYSSTTPHFKAYERNNSTYQRLCNLEGSALYPSSIGKLPKCCNLKDSEDGLRQGNDIFKGAYCGCDPNPQTWGSGKVCRLTTEHSYLPYFATVEHGETNITPFIDGPKGEDVGDYIVDTRFGYFDGGYSNGGLFFPSLGEDLSNSAELKNMTRDDGKYLQNPAYKILKENNVTELYFSGYGEHGLKSAIKEAQALGFMNITIISDTWDSHMLYYNGNSHMERRQNAFQKLQKEFPDVKIQTSTELVKNHNTTSGYNNEFKIVEPECRGKNFAEPKRAFIALNLQKGLLSSCTNTEKISNVTVPDSHRIVPRTNAFLEWSQHKKFFTQIYFTQTRSHNDRVLNETEYAFSEDLFFDSAVTQTSLDGSIKDSTFFKSLSDQGVTQLFLAGIALDEIVLEVAREAHQIGFSVFIITDLTQSRNSTLQEGTPLESLMKFYYDLADNEKIFSLKTTDLSDEFYPEPNFTIPFPKWIDEDGCIKEEAPGQIEFVSNSHRLSGVWIITILLLT